MRTLIRTLTYHRLQILELLLFAAKNEFNDVISSLTNTTVMKKSKANNILLVFVLLALYWAAHPSPKFPTTAHSLKKRQESKKVEIL